MQFCTALALPPPPPPLPPLPTHASLQGPLHQMAGQFAGALAGNPFGVDRQALAKDLGFIGGVCPNSMDAVSDRDFVLETLFATATHLVHLSRWAEDLIIYSSGQFKFVQCSDAYATGEVVCLSAFGTTEKIWKYGAAIVCHGIAISQNAQNEMPIILVKWSLPRCT